MGTVATYVRSYVVSYTVAWVSTNCIALCTPKGAFRKLVDIMFVGAMGPPGGGRNPITPRFSRHFNHISFTELEDSSKFTIFSTIVASWLGSFQNAETLVSLAENNATLISE